jgi:hypothetical protein
MAARRRAELQAVLIVVMRWPISFPKTYAMSKEKPMRSIVR